MLIVKLLLLFLVLHVAFGEEEADNIDPSIDQDPTEKDHNKRTLLFNHHNFGIAKHIKLHNGKKILLGYAPVDLKYVPVIRHPGYHGLRFRPRPRPHWTYKPNPVYGPPVKPIIQTDGWKPIIGQSAHVPAPLPVRPWQEQGWSTPSVVSAPSVPDHVHHVDHVNHGDHVHHFEHVDSVKPVISVTTPVVTPVATPVATSVATPAVPVVAPLPVVQPAPVQPVLQLPPSYLGYNPLLTVAKPNLPVYPLGATFPAHLLPARHPHVTHLHPVHPVAPAVPATPVPVPVPVQPAVAPTVPVHTPLHPAHPHYHHITDSLFNYHAHPYPTYVPQVHEPPQEPAPPAVHQPVHPPVIQQQPPSPAPTPNFSQNIEYHGHHSKYIHLDQPYIQPGSTGQPQDLNNFFSNLQQDTDGIQPGNTDLQIPTYLPQHPNYQPTQYAGNVNQGNDYFTYTDGVNQQVQYDDGYDQQVKK